MGKSSLSHSAYTNYLFMSVAPRKAFPVLKPINRSQISIEVCETESHGVVLRYCPLESGCGGEADGAGLRAALGAQLHVLRATVELREPFRERVAAEPALRLVRVPGWAGE